jgi:hypothetical protein
MRNAIKVEVETKRTNRTTNWKILETPADAGFNHQEKATRTTLVTINLSKHSYEFN